MKRIPVAVLLVLVLLAGFALGGCAPDKAQLSREVTKAAAGDIPLQGVTVADDGKVTVTLAIPEGYFGNGGERRCSELADTIIAKVDGVKSVKIVDSNGVAIGEYRKP